MKMPKNVRKLCPNCRVYTDQTIEIVRTVNPDKIRTNLTVIYPGTELYDECKEKGWLWVVL